MAEFETSRPTKLLLFVGFSAIIAMLYSIIWALNAAQWDDWIYYLYASTNSLTVLGSNRQFGITQSTVGDILLPATPQLALVMQMINILISALILYYLYRRLTVKSGWLALIFAIIFMMYIPSNRDVALPYFTGLVYSWATMLYLLATVLLILQDDRQGWQRWGMLIAASMVAYIAIRSQEATLPLLGVAPILLYILTKQITRRFLTALVIWNIGVGIAALQIIVPLFLGDQSVAYQIGKTESSNSSLLIIPEQLFTLIRNSFPFHLYVSENLYDVLGFGLIVAGISGCFILLFWRWNEYERSIPVPRFLVLTMFVGLVIIVLSGLVPAYAGIAHHPRFQFMAAPGQALVVVGVFGLLAHGVKRLLNVSVQRTLFGMVIVYSLIGAAWHYDAQDLADDSNFETRSFDTSIAFFHDFAAILPHVEDDTLIIYVCPEKAYPYNWTIIDGVASYYLYNHSVHIAIPEYVSLQSDDIRYEYPTEFIQPEPLFFTYEQLIIVRCADGYLYVSPNIPESIIPAAANIDESEYRPFARISDGFITGRRGRMLGF